VGKLHIGIDPGHILPVGGEKVPRPKVDEVLFVPEFGRGPELEMEGVLSLRDHVGTVSQGELDRVEGDALLFHTSLKLPVETKAGMVPLAVGDHGDYVEGRGTPCHLIGTQSSYRLGQVFRAKASAIW